MKKIIIFAIFLFGLAFSANAIELGNYSTPIKIKIVPIKLIGDTWVNQNLDKEIIKALNKSGRFNASYYHPDGDEVAFSGRVIKKSADSYELNYHVYDYPSKKIIESDSFVIFNDHVIYGSDVISNRIHAIYFGEVLAIREYKERKAKEEEEKAKLTEQEALKEKAKKIFAEVKKKAEENSSLSQSNSEEKQAETTQDLNINSVPIEIQLWNSIKDSDDPEEYQIYLDEYPNGSFAKIAKYRIKKLSVPSPSIPDMNFGKYHALIIGNDKYKHLSPLSNAVNDANDVAALLRSKYKFNVNLLTNATRNEIVSALSKLRNSISSSDNLLVYYAGHGYLDKEADEGFWLPVDAEIDNDVHWVANETIMRSVRAMQAKHIMVVADSCFSGTLTRGIKIKDNSPDYIKKIIQKKARTVLTSGGLEPVSDVGGGNNSVFASSFLNALSDNDGVLDGNQLFSIIRKQVMLNSDQTPEYGDIRKAGHDGGDFIFVSK